MKISNMISSIMVQGLRLKVQGNRVRGSGQDPVYHIGLVDNVPRPVGSKMDRGTCLQKYG
jgi:hypothetical protein